MNLKECPECGKIRQLTGQGWSGVHKKQTYRCINKDCSQYGRRTMKVKQEKTE